MKIFLLILALLLVIAVIILLVLNHFGLLEFVHDKVPTDNDKIKIACVGDSITYGCMCKNRKRNCYPAVLQTLLGEKYSVGNFGYTNRTANFDGDYPLVREKIYKQSQDFEPNIVILLLGSNDSKENNWDEEKFKQSLEKMVDEYLTLPTNPTVYLVTPPPAFKKGKKVLYDLDAEKISNEIYTFVCETAKKKNIELIDAYKMFDRKEEMFADGVHFNPNGTKYFAEKVCEKIEENR